MLRSLGFNYTPMQADSPLLVVVLGLPGTGKTTFARALADRLGAVHLNTDMLRAELGLQGHYDEAAKAGIYRELLQRCRAELDLGRTVILDGTFYRKAFRNEISRLAREGVSRLRWIELSADPETVKQRVSKQRPYSEADFAVYQKIRDAYEPLQVEHLQLVSDRQTTAAMLGQALKYLRR